MAVNFTVNLDDLAFILKQIKIAERHAAGEALQDIIGQDYAILPYGLRAVDGSENNLLPGGQFNGAADQPFPRLLPPDYITDTSSGAFGPVTNNNYALPGSVVDSNPRTISNLIVDMTVDNPAAIEAWFNNPLSVAAWQDAHPGMTPVAPPQPGGPPLGPNEIALTNADIANIPNQSPDIGLSPAFNGWMTFFGQFFDHGLDLATKGGNGTVFIPLQPDDPLFNAGADGIPGTADDGPNFMALTRATPVIDPATGQPTATNTTTPWIDQNQTYTSHPSHQAFLREYAFTVDTNADGIPDSGPIVATGHLLSGASGAIANWAEVKAQAKTMLGIALTDYDVLNVPLLETDQYGELRRGPNGFAQIKMSDGSLLEGNAQGLAIPLTALRTNHAFLDDIAHTAVPTTSRGGLLLPDADLTVGDHLTGPAPGFYDNELLDAHFITGDGRGNENIGLTTVHTIFHSEHNRIVEANKDTIVASGNLAFINEWLRTPITADQIPTTAAGIDALNWDGERLFQSAKFVTEMEYQHLVFEEFARKVQPNVDAFVFTNTPDINPAITAEFAHVVYRFGHSMLTETVSRLDPHLTQQDISLFDAFLNPLQFTAGGPTVDEQAGAVIRGMTRQAGNEIDEFVTEALRNNLVGLPLDLAALNMARAREQGVPSFNEARAQFFDMTGDIQLKPYASWSEYGQNIKNPLSIVNFIAAYGTHPSITAATTLEAKRDAATLLVLGDFNVDGIAGNEVAPADRLDFLNHTGAWASAETGLNNVDFWIGGLAESKMEFGGMLGTTFNFVFEAQMEKLQDADRFYYLSRTQGLNLLNQLEPNTFSELVMRNTDLGDLHATHLPGSLFDTVDFTLELDPETKQVTDVGPNGAFLLGASSDPKQPDARTEALNPKVVRVAPGADVDGDGNGDGGVLQFKGGEHVVLGGTEGNDTLIGDRGIDTLWGDGGNDRLNAGSESDQVFGGDGDDIITDPFGDDTLRGENGNDVISGGPGFDLLFGGPGKDFITGSTDIKEVFAGEGDDFILGGSAPDNLMGNEGDDWIEGGEGFDSLSGENSQLFFNSTIVGHDVLNGQNNDTDYDGENGDDIMVQGPGIQRSNGMDGFDWAIHKGDPSGADSDLGIRPFDTRQALILRDRFDSVEGLSGWNGNDILTGAAHLVIGENFVNTLTQAGVDRITGLRELLGNPAPGAADDVVFDSAAGAGIGTTGGEIILGGAGSDRIRGNLGNDIIDGDAWLNVRIEVHANKDGTGPLVTNLASVGSDGSIESLKEITADLLSGVINPGQLKIVREIVTAPAGNSTDVAVFSDVLANYTIEGRDLVNNVAAFDTNGDGFITVSHDVGGPGLGIDGVDKLKHIERLEFADTSVRIAGNNTAATGEPTISDTTPTQGQLLTASRGTMNDADGFPGASAAISWAWQSSGDGVLWTPVATGQTFTPDATLPGQFLRVVATFTDNQGALEVLTSASTAAVINVPDPGSVTISGAPTENAILSAVVVDPDGLTVAGVPVPISYQWEQGLNGSWSAIAGATGPTFIPDDPQVGQQLHVIATYTDAGGFHEVVTSAPTLAITNVNDAPSGIVAVGGALAVNESSDANGALVGSVIGQDVDGPALTYSLVDNAAGRFVIDPTSGAVSVATGVLLDFEQAPSHSITVRVSDGIAAPFEKTLTVAVNNVDPEHVIGTAGNNTIAGGVLNDFIDGARGHDTVLFNYQSSLATLSVSGNDIVVSGPDGTDTLRNVERVQFLDRAIDRADENVMVDDLFYYAKNPDVWQAKMDPDVHYSQFGWHEGRDPNASFSTSGYLAANPDVAAAGVDPLDQFHVNGWHQGRDPGAGFDAQLYLARYPDVKAAGMDPLQHYLQFGQAEGRQAYTAIGRAPDIMQGHGFDAEYYLLANPDVARAASASGSDTYAFAQQHYDTFGWHENRNPNSVFDTKGYLTAYVDVANSKMNPLTHYDTFGWHEGRDPSAGFDTAQYLSHYADVASAAMDPMTHYLAFGALEGRSTFTDGHFA